MSKTLILLKNSQPFQCFHHFHSRKGPFAKSKFYQPCVTVQRTVKLMRLERKRLSRGLCCLTFFSEFWLVFLLLTSGSLYGHNSGNHQLLSVQFWCLKISITWVLRISSVANPLKCLFISSSQQEICQGMLSPLMRISIVFISRKVYNISQSNRFCSTNPSFA